MTDRRPRETARSDIVGILAAVTVALFVIPTASSMLGSESVVPDGSTGFPPISASAPHLLACPGGPAPTGPDADLAPPTLGSTPVAFHDSPVAGRETIITSRSNATYSSARQPNRTSLSTTTTAGTFKAAQARANVTAAPVASAAPPLYNVSFVESSLAEGVSWYVNVSGQTSRSATVTATGGDEIQVPLENGTYGFTASTDEAPWTWDSSLTGFTFVVSGASTAIPVYFEHTVGPTVYSVEFVEQGLPVGQTFGVQIDGLQYSEVAPSPVATHLANGTYAFTVTTDPPYTANITSGQFVVSGAPQTIHLSFSNAPAGAASEPVPPWLWISLALAVAIVAALLFLIFERRRKKK